MKTTADTSGDWGDCICADCGVPTYPEKIDPGGTVEFYSVTDDIWDTCGAGTGFLCIGCLEARLGRQLTSADFTDAPVNSLDPVCDRYAWSQRSPRLRARLAGAPSAPGCALGPRTG